MTFPLIDGTRPDWSAIDLTAAPSAVGHTNGALEITVSIAHDGSELADDEWIGIDHSGVICDADNAELAWRGTVRDFKAMLKEKL